MATYLIMSVVVKNSVTSTVVRVTSLRFRRGLMVLIFLNDDHPHDGGGGVCACAAGGDDVNADHLVQVQVLSLLDSHLPFW